MCTNLTVCVCVSVFFVMYLCICVQIYGLCVYVLSCLFFWLCVHVHVLNVCVINTSSNVWPPAPSPGVQQHDVGYITALVEDFQLEAARFKGVPVPRPEQMKLGVEVYHWDLSVPPPMYASPVWDPHYQTDFNFLEKIQKRGARFATGNYCMESGNSTKLSSFRLALICRKKTTSKIDHTSKS